MQFPLAVMMHQSSLDPTVTTFYLWYKIVKRRRNPTEFESQVDSRENECVERPHCANYRHVILYEDARMKFQKQTFLF